MTFIRFQIMSVLLLLLAAGAPARGAEDALQELGFVSDAVSETATARYQRPPSKIAENVTVVTAEQIAHLNAHTLAEVLPLVSGFQLDAMRTPGLSTAGISINGLPAKHILLLLDGVIQNDPTNNWSDIGLIPANLIERVEVIKGAASAAWGPALGGVINVITKSAAPERQAGGALTSSYGERGTADLNGEASGALGRLGYYLYGGNLHSRGLLPGTRTNINSLFGKASYQLPTSGLASLSATISDAFRGMEENAPLDYRDTVMDRSYSFKLNLQQPLSQQLNIKLLSSWNKNVNNTIWGQMTYDPPFMNYHKQQQYSDSKAELTWQQGKDSLTAGATYQHYTLRENFLWSGLIDPEKTRKLDAGGIYLNGSAEFGRFTILPGIRYDRTISGKDAVRYNLGATYQFAEKSVFRIYAADGFGLPSLDDTLNDLQKVWTLQSGIESGDIPYLWLKGTVFYNRAANVSRFDPVNSAFVGQVQIRQGFEVELKTVPFHGLSTGLGYTYLNTYDHSDRDIHIDDSPTNSLKLTLNYDNRRAGTTATLFGNYVWWNQSSESQLDGPPYYKPVIWDLHINQKLLPKSELSPEIFFSGHNLFNGSQYNSSLYRNARRWLEGGVRFRF